jgi:hypothetical protein
MYIDSSFMYMLGTLKQHRLGTGTPASLPLTFFGETSFAHELLVCGCGFLVSPVSEIVTQGFRSAANSVRLDFANRPTSKAYFCAGVSISFWYAALSVPLLLAIGSRVG